MSPQLSSTDLAYIAAVIDSQGIIRSRKTKQGVLPLVALHGPNIRLLQYLAGLTGTKVTITRREFLRSGCREHCPEQHQHITSESGRWSVTGAKATILLAAIRPYMRLQGYQADQAIAQGLVAPRKEATASKMTELGWPLPEWGLVEDSSSPGGIEESGGAVV